MRNRPTILALGVLCTMLVGNVAQADIQVKPVDNGWKVEAQKEPLTSVLNAIAMQAGIKVSGTTKLVEDPVLTGVYTGSLDTVLRRLLRGSDYAFETVADNQGQSRITRLIVLSGTKGKAPSARMVKAARKLPATTPAQKPLSAEEKDQGKRVTSLLTRRAQLGGGIQAEAASENADDDQTNNNATGTGISRNADGSFDITPEAQSRMAEATQRAQQDLQALVSSIRRNENNQNGDN